MRFGGGGFGYKGQFDRVEVGIDEVVTAATVTATPSKLVDWVLVAIEQLESVLVDPAFLPMNWTILPMTTRKMVSFMNGFLQPPVGSYIYDIDNPTTRARVLSTVTQNGTWGYGAVEGFHVVDNVSAAFPEYCMIGIEGYYWVYFFDGYAEIVPSMTLVGDVSGGSCTVVSVMLFSGTWGGGDAEGIILVNSVTAPYVETGEEAATGVLGGSSDGHATLQGDPVLNDFMAYCLGYAEETNTVTLPAVMYYIDINYAVLLEAGVDVAAEKFADWGLAPVLAVGYAIPASPLAKVYIAEPGTVNSLNTASEASFKLSDKMGRGKFAFERAVMGLSEETYFRNIAFKMQDYAGVYQTVFEGFFTSGNSTIDASGDFETFTAFDYAWYLTMQFLSDDQKVFLTPAEQQAVTLYQLNYNSSGAPPKVGQMLIGTETGDAGMIMEVVTYGADAPRVILRCPTGTFENEEELTVDGVRCGYADGVAVDVTGTGLPVVYPAGYVEGLLGGAMYESTTGIMPFRMTEFYWGPSSDPVAVTFAFEEKTTKIQAIEQLAKYLHYIFVVKSMYVKDWVAYNYPVSGATQYTCAYFIPEAYIDLPSPMGLDLPAMVTISNPNPYLLSPVTIERRGDERYNKVTVRCQSITGVWYQCILPTTPVTDEPQIEYYEINPNIASQAECDARCADIYNYYKTVSMTYSATFIKRSDFRMLQRLQFSGYGYDIPDGIYRIIGINYNLENAGTVDQVTVSLILDSQFKFYLNLNRMFTDSVTEIQKVIKSELDKLAQVEVGTIDTINPDGSMIIRTEAGQPKQTRNPTY